MDKVKRRLRIVVVVSRSWDGESATTVDLSDDGIEMIQSNDAVKEHSVSQSTSSGRTYLDVPDTEQETENVARQENKNSKPVTEAYSEKPEKVRVETKNYTSTVELTKKDVGEDAGKCFE